MPPCRVTKADVLSVRPFIRSYSLTFRAPRLVDEWTAKLSPFSIQGHLSEFSRIMVAKTLKHPYRLQTVTFFPRRGRKPKFDQKSRKLRIQWLWQLEHLPQADFGCAPDSSILSVRTKSITDCILKITAIVFFLERFNECLYLEPTH